MTFLKGVIIGIGKIIPGISGAMLAISMGVYDKLIYSIDNLLKDFKNNFIYLLKIGLGIILSILLLSNIILNTLNRYYIITMFLFIGLIIGSLENIKYKLKDKKYIFLGFIILLILNMIISNSNISIKLNSIGFISIGIIEAITMIIPGISGTATLMMLGVYNEVIQIFTIKCFDFKYIVLFFIGIIIGVLLLTKIINYLLNNFKVKMYSLIYGFSIYTIIFMAISALNSKYTLFELFIAYIFLILGKNISKKINQIG